MNFKLKTSFTPSSDQRRAIDDIARGFREDNKFITLLGVTGSGKTFTMAKVIELLGKPSLVLTHNKTLAAQLYREFREFFPENAVEYFVSYYDYYQPEAYVASQDLYIEKDSSINDEIDRLRLKATSSLMERRDVIIVSSVSCIYGLGNPEEFEKRHIALRKGHSIDRDELLRKLVSIYYERNDIDFQRGRFRVRGDTIDIFPAYLKNAFRVELFGDEIESIRLLDPLTGKIGAGMERIDIYPAKHFVTSPDEMKTTVGLIEKELEERLTRFRSEGKLLEAQRLESRTHYDIEMMQEMGYCSGIENYSRIISRREAGERPACLLDYFKNDYITFIDESHVTLPQVRGMYHGDRSRKQSLVDHGFRLPSALDNRPLYFEEFVEMTNRALFVSATPGDYEIENSSSIVEQVIRPTGLLDPVIEIRPASQQVDDLIAEVRKRSERNERTLVTTLTKKMAEDLSDYFQEAGIRAKYLHSEIETIERVELIRDLRKGEFDCLIGINLLREGLDIPEVSLVAILDADKEGFLRSARSLIQTAGRAARNVNGTVIFYAESVTASMQSAIDETTRRRSIQEQYNREHRITPRTISKEVLDIIEREYRCDDSSARYVLDFKGKYRLSNVDELRAYRDLLRDEMLSAADNLDFERAALLRDQMIDIEKKLAVQEKKK